jgi:hypothetical protein
LVLFRLSTTYGTCLTAKKFEAAKKIKANRTPESTKKETNKKHSIPIIEAINLQRINSTQLSY